jgi:ABC-type polysaccharide/polyol phosphate transport system ATPase subunit
MIKCENLSLEYLLYRDQTSSIKEFLINRLHRRKELIKSNDHLLALDNINLTISEGDRLGILGFNGAGKSTLLKVISGILKPTHGKLTTIGQIQPLIEIGAGFNPEFSGRDNIYLNSYMLGFSKKEIAQKEFEIIKFSELEEFIDVPIKYYSSGMVVRLAFSIATTIRPEILVLDEMLSAGDLTFINKAKARMNEIINTAKILVLVSHDLNLIESLTKTCIILDKGKIIFQGTTHLAIQHYKDLASQRSLV